MTKEIVARECRFAIHIPAKHGLRPDAHLIKECVHYNDGSTEPHIKLIPNFKRKFWITKPAYRNHQDKKEFESLDKLTEFECTESELRDKVAAALEKSYCSDPLRKLANSPYLYGSDISSTTTIKRKYQEKYPNINTPYSVAYLDTETRPIGKQENLIVLCTVVYQDKVYTAVLKKMVPGVADIQRAVDVAMDKYLPQYKGKLTTEVEVFNTEVELIKASFNKLHSWLPDFVSIWNMDFDVSRIIESLQRARQDPKDILSDPNIPKELRFFKYIQGKKKKVTASGKVMPVSPASRWHTLLLSAGFYIVDGMCVFKQLRIAEGERPSYALNAILDTELGTRKLSFTEADHLKELDWHLFMQDNYPIEYIIYNRYDCLSMQELEQSDKIKDIAYKLPEFAATTDFQRFNSQPRKISDALFWDLLEDGYVLGTVGYKDDFKPNDVDEEVYADNGDPEDEEEDLDTLSLKDWILTLRADHQVSGLRLIQESNTIQTNIRGMVYDSDAVSAYPTGISVCNVSKETTYRELIDVEGVTEEVFRGQNINLMSGSINSVEYCLNLFGFPKLQDLLTEYQRQQ